MSFTFIPGDDLVDDEYELTLHGRKMTFSIQVNSGTYYVNEYGRNRTGLWCKTLKSFTSLRAAKKFCLQVANQ